ncbi:Uncharacterised protein [Legionella busanensis]|uniref:Uncharacterized protein n=1 Tax=Legionella busanensis TaxID=190655 RepID=A0A378JRI4_9GAMM|nr:hypothetical protein [Legionella busanensis]STX50742.1 Uncharacterised protein [Legionella busanensis]
MKIRVEVYDEVNQKLVEADIKETARPNNFFIAKLKVDGQVKPIGQILFAIHKDNLYIANLSNLDSNYSRVGTILTRYAFTQSLNFNKQGKIELEAVNNSSPFWKKMGFEAKAGSINGSMYLSDETIKNKVATNFALDTALVTRTSEMNVPKVTSTVRNNEKSPPELNQSVMYSDSRGPAYHLYQAPSFFKGKYNLPKQNIRSLQAPVILNIREKLAITEDFVWKKFEDEVADNTYEPEEQLARDEENESHSQTQDNLKEKTERPDSKQTEEELDEAQRIAETNGFIWKNF